MGHLGGWLARTLKAFLWMAYEPVQPEHILHLLGYKYLLNIPFGYLRHRRVELAKVGGMGTSVGVHRQFDIFYR